MVRLTILCIVVFWLILGPGSGEAAENCTVCHRITLTGKHGRLPCLSCHLSETVTVANPAGAGNQAIGCRSCHGSYGEVLRHVMGTGLPEQAFVSRSFAKADPQFYGKNCNSCHLKGCLDCHEGGGHAIGKARDSKCFTCHRGYFTGSDYYGMAPREENLRYQRGAEAYGETFLKMLPDVHAEAGLTCGACHSMASLAAGKKAAKGCLNCHKVDERIIEHRIAAHRERLECYACHSAWAAQEYGTFYLRFRDSPSQSDYQLRSNNGGEYVKSVYLKQQDAPPLGVNGKGLVSPIRPQFIAYYGEISNDKPVGQENRLLAAEWKAFFPHTIRRGTVMCEGCHDNPRRFVMEKPNDRVYRLRQDGMTLDSFWTRDGQRVANGDFLAVSRYLRLSAKSPAYQRAYLEKWRNLINRVDNSSRH